MFYKCDRVQRKSDFQHALLRVFDHIPHQSHINPTSFPHHSHFIPLDLTSIPHHSHIFPHQSHTNPTYSHILPHICTHTNNSMSAYMWENTRKMRYLMLCRPTVLISRALCKHLRKILIIFILSRFCVPNSSQEIHYLNIFKSAGAES